MNDQAFDGWERAILTRRELLARAGMGMGCLALEQLAGGPAIGVRAAEVQDGAIRSCRRLLSSRPKPSMSSTCS